MQLSSYPTVLRKLLSAVTGGIILTVVLSLVGRYEPGTPHHYIHNGLPLPTFTQVIDTTSGSLIAARPDFIGIVLDAIFFTLAWAFLTEVVTKLRNRPKAQ